MYSGFSKDEASLDITLMSVSLSLLVRMSYASMTAPHISKLTTVLTFLFFFVFDSHFACCVFVRKG